METVNALVTLWDQYTLIYVFPPLKLPNLLHMIEMEGILVFLIAPDWPRQVRYTDKVGLLAGAHWAIPDLDHPALWCWLLQYGC